MGEHRPDAKTTTFSVLYALMAAPYLLGLLIEADEFISRDDTEGG